MYYAFEKLLSEKN